MQGLIESIKATDDLPDSIRELINLETAKLDPDDAIFFSGGEDD